MKRVLGTAGFVVAFAAAGLAQNFANQTATIRNNGRNMSGSSGNQFMVAEGANFAAFASYGMARWNLAQLKSDLDLQFGANNWNVTLVELVLFQTNATFAADGTINVHYTSDDTSDITTAACPFRWPLNDGLNDPVHSGTPLLTYGFVDCNCVQGDVYTLYSSGDTGDRLVLANDIENASDSSLTLIVEDGDPAVAASYRGMTAGSGANQPELRVTAVPISGNPPTASAGPDQLVNDPDNNGVENVTLDGTGSHANPPASSISSYVWREGVTQVATGASPTISVALGTHTYVLTVTDNLGGTASDTVVIDFPVVTVANAGANSTVTANACDGTASATLDGTASTYNAGTITSYTWTNDYDGSVVASTATANVSLGVGTHTFRLHIVGSGGQTDDDVRTIDVRPTGVFAGHDFDSLFANLVTIVPSGPWSNPTRAFNLLQRGTGSIPFAIADDSLVTFPGDAQGVVNDKKLDAFFGINDMQHATDNPTGTGTATFQFTISGRSNIKIAIDLGAMGNFEATTTPPDAYTFTAVVDGGSPITVFTVTANEGPTQNYRLASGTLASSIDPLWVDGTTNLINVLRTFTFPLNVTGNNLTLTLSASSNGDGEAFVFDNILLYECTGGGDPCPCPGDVNNDGLRDINDLTLFLSAFGLPATNCADVNGDGVVDINDLTLFLSGFGVPCP